MMTDGPRILLNRSKSIIIRQMIAEYLYNAHLMEVLPSDSGDVKTIHNCLKVIDSAKGNVRSITPVDVGDCGAAYRFLLALLSVTKGNWLLTGSPRLLVRPIAPLVSALTDAGAHIQQTDNGWHIRGREWKAPKMTVDCSQSSQFASALLLISKKIGLEDLTVTPDIPPSAPYITLTQHVLEDTLSGSRSYDNEGDWSSAAFWYACLAISPHLHSLRLADLDLNSLQGDRAVARFFESFGIQSIQTGHDVVIQKASHPDVGILSLDLSLTPDLAPILAAFAVAYPADLKMSGLQNLNLKESHRLKLLEEVLSIFAPTKVTDDSTLQVIGTQRYDKQGAPITLSTHQDHRMVMAFTLLQSRYPIQLDGVECVSKSYPDFLSQLLSVRP